MRYLWGCWLMKYAIKFIYVVSAAAILASCGGRSNHGGDVAGLPEAPSRDSVADIPMKIGAPYQIGATTYTPEDVAAYDDVGYASFYGQELEGRQTASGEVFMASGISAAHKTLPLPTYAEITALDTGKTILVRINDRGPFANDRLIDLSLGAAQQLGITGQGVTGVRVRKVNPPEQERAALRSGRSVPERIETPESLLRVLRMKLAQLPAPGGSVAPSSAPVRDAVSRPQYGAQTQPAEPSGQFIREGYSAQPPRAPAPKVAPRVATKAAPAPTQDGRFVREGENSAPARAASPAMSGGYVVQLASFSSRARAEALAKKLGATVGQSDGGQVYRVRYGPYASEAEAQQGLATARQRGYSQARIFRE
jgi:rare lipoprotein A